MKRLCMVLLLCSGQLQAADRTEYLRQLPTFWKTLYPQGGETLYCGHRFRPFDRRVNVEHVYPMGWVVKALRCGSRQRCQRVSRRFQRIEADMHNLYPALKRVNKARGAMAYGRVERGRRMGRGCNTMVNKQRRRVQPRAEVRGDIARAILYMSETYDLALYPRQRRLMQRWHRADPPDAAERRRNRLIKRLQGNGNPYIGRR